LSDCLLRTRYIALASRQLGVAFSKALNTLVRAIVGRNPFAANRCS